MREEKKCVFENWRPFDFCNFSLKKLLKYQIVADKLYVESANSIQKELVTFLLFLM